MKLHMTAVVRVSIIQGIQRYFLDFTIREE